MNINEKLKSLNNHDAISLHVPGHHNHTIGYLDEVNLAMDMTEITGLDDLHQPESCIKMSMSELNRYPGYYGKYLVNGTTVGILSAIYAVAHLEGEVLIPRNAHKSVFNALNLTKQDAKFMPMTISVKTNQYNGVASLRDLDLNNIKLAVFTYPNYYGETFDIEESIKILKEHKIPVLVDEAHGAHFGISSNFPKSSMTYGADIVVQSYHKTLPVLTMGSVIYMKEDLEIKADIQQYLKMLQTSSPSYLIMASLESAEKFYKQFDDQKFKFKRQTFIETMENVGFEVGSLEDPLKLIVSYKGLSGFEIQKLFEGVHIYVELCDYKFVLLVLPLWHESDKFPFEDMIDRVRNIKLNVEHQLKEEVQFKLPYQTDSTMYKYSDIEKTKMMNLNTSYGYIAAEDIVSYPPGIPVILKGENIRKEIVYSLLQWIDRGGRVEGILNKQIKVKDEQ